MSDTPEHIDEWSTRNRDEPYVAAIRIALGPMVKDGRTRAQHIKCVWCNYCDWFVSRAAFDAAVAAGRK
jgi:hypothetical protein